jgi:hypothetical protein
MNRPWTADSHGRVADARRAPARTAGVYRRRRGEPEEALPQSLHWRSGTPAVLAMLT